MKKTERTGKAFYMKWLLLALFAAALIIMPAASKKVSAAKMVYTVKFNNNSGTSKSKTYTALTRNVTLNTTIKLPSVPNAVGYQNLGWTTQKGSTKVVYKAGASVKVTRDMNLYAVRRKSRYYTVSFYLGNGSSNSTYRKLQKKVEEGTYYTLPTVPSRSGYVNLGWSTTVNGKTSTAKKAGTAKITATIGKTRLTCTVNVKKASTGSSKYTKNYTKVKKYLNKKGKVDSDGTRYIEKKIDAHTTAILGYDPKTNKLDIGLAIIDKKADVSSAVDVLVNCSKSATAEAISAIFGDGNETYATAKFNANSYTGKKDVTFRKLSGSKAPKSIQKASNATLQAAIAGANYILSSKLHMTVKDLGFTAYQ